MFSARNGLKAVPYIGNSAECLKAVPYIGNSAERPEGRSPSEPSVHRDDHRHHEYVGDLESERHRWRQCHDREHQSVRRLQSAEQSVAGDRKRQCNRAADQTKIATPSVAVTKKQPVSAPCGVCRERASRTRAHVRCS
jgi:hypothetical protein